MSEGPENDLKLNFKVCWSVDENLEKMLINESDHD